MKRDPRRGQRRRGAARQRRAARSGRRNLTGRARSTLRAFRQASVLAVALTAFILLFVGDAGAQDAETDAAEVSEVQPTTTPDAREATEAAVGSLRATWVAFSSTWPKVAIALIILTCGWAVARLLRAVVHRVTGSWRRSVAFSALAGIAVWLLAIGLAASVVAGDLRALVGSLGLIGLALSWALQTPIESFTGWLLNSFQGYYRVSDRVVVGDVFGDVLRIDFLTTTVWEIGTPQRPGFVNAEQPTGRLVTFPNSEVLAGTIVNLTRDFPYVWDELPVAVANESNLRLAMQVLERTARELLATQMLEPVRQYRTIMAEVGLTEIVAEQPQVFAAATNSWTDLSIRYLVPARERRKWKSELLLRTSEALAQPEVAAHVYPAYIRRQVQSLDAAGRPADWRSPDASSESGDSARD